MRGSVALALEPSFELHTEKSLAKGGPVLKKEKEMREPSEVRVFLRLVLMERVDRAGNAP